MSRLLVLIAFVLFLIAGLVSVAHADLLAPLALVAFGLASWAASQLIP